MSNGIRTTNLERSFVIDELIGNVTEDSVEKTARLPLEALASQLAGTGPFILGNTVYALTKADLDAYTPPNEMVGGVVLNDPNAANNGYYARSGAAWVKGRGFPDSVVLWTQTGGTSNALQVTASAGVDPANVVLALLVPTLSNSAGATVSINGAAAIPILSASGAPLAAGELVGGMASLLAKVGSAWRLLNSNSQLPFRKAWNSATTYVADDLVERGGSLWLALRPNTNITPVEGDDWTLFLPGVTVAEESVTDAMVVSFGATSPRATKIAYSPPIASPALRSVGSKLWDKPSIRDFDLGGGDGNAADALQSAIDEGVTHKKAAYVPAGDFNLMSGVTVQSQFGLVGDGAGRSKLWAIDMNAPLISIITAGSAIEDSCVQDLEAIAYYTDPSVIGSSANFIRFSGTEDYVQHNRYRNLIVRGFAVAFKNDMPAGLTPFGYESFANWQRFDDVLISSFSRPCYVGWDFAAGSGTGNVWSGIETSVGGEEEGVTSPGTVMRFGGDGCVVGDIILSNSHLGGSPGSTVFEGSASTVYRQRIALIGNQYDAGMDAIFSLDSGGGGWSNLVVDGNNIGGNAVLSNYMPPVRNSKISDQEVGQWLSGKFRSGLPSGAQVLNVFDIGMSDYDGTMLEVVASGLVPGVAGGSTMRRVLLAAGAGGAGTVTLVENVSTAPGDPSFLAISVTPTGYGARVSVALTPGSSGAYVDTQIRAISGKVKVVRL